MAREVVEEIGWEAESLESLGSIFTSPGFSSQRMHLFVARLVAVRGDESRGHRENQRTRVGLGRGTADDGARGD